MVSYQRGGGAKQWSASSSSTEPFTVLNPAETRALGRSLRDVYSPMWFGGDLTSPIARTLSRLAYEGGTQEAKQELGTLSTTKGVSGPAKAAIGKGAVEAAVTGAAGVPLNIWTQAGEGLKGLITSLGQVGTSLSTSGGKSRTGGGGGFCCYVVCATDPTDELLEYVRRYKDSHYDIDSMVAQGYKRLALWLVPPMRRYNWVKQVIKWVMVHPMELYAKAYYERKHLSKLLLTPVAKFWVGVYAMVGHLYGLRNWHDYWKLGDHF